MIKIPIIGRDREGFLPMLFILFGTFEIPNFTPLLNGEGDAPRPVSRSTKMSPAPKVPDYEPTIQYRSITEINNNEFHSERSFRAPSHSSIIPNIFQEHTPKKESPKTKSTETKLSTSKFYNVQQDTSYIYFIAKKLLEIDNSETTKIEVFKILFNQMLIRINTCSNVKTEIYTKLDINLFNDFSFQQLNSIKQTVQSELNVFEQHFGRSKSKIEKSILKPMYSLYRQLKHRIHAEITELPKSP